jgi:hypothetical protein
MAFCAFVFKTGRGVEQQRECCSTCYKEKKLGPKSQINRIQIKQTTVDI